MARTTDALVKGVLLKDYDTRNSPSLTPFITAAGSVVDRMVTKAIAAKDPLTSGEASVIETWLAAHFYACSDKPYASKSTDRAGGSFAGKTGMAFASTLYGQMAMSLDFSGYLSSVGSGEKTATKPTVVSLASDPTNPGSTTTPVSGATLGKPEIDANAVNVNSEAA